MYVTRLKLNSFALLALTTVFLTGCFENAQITTSGGIQFSSIAPIATNISPPSFNEDVSSIITLEYTDVELNRATGCSVSNLQNVSVTKSCACSAGTCNVTIKGVLNTFGGASFDYTVSDGLVSNTATATLDILSVNDAPIINNVGTVSSREIIEEDVAKDFNFNYSDVESDAVTCTMGTLNNVTILSCSCSVGLCTFFGVQGSPADYSGLASFTYTVTDSQPVNPVSNTATAYLSITPVNDPPAIVDVGSSGSPTALAEDVVINTITFTYTDAENDPVACSPGTLSNVAVSSCSCAAGVCTFSGVQGSPADYNGPASFTYTVTDGQAVNPISNTATAYLNITAVNDAPIGTGSVSPSTLVQDTPASITLGYADVDGIGTAQTCAITSVNKVSVIGSCTCDVSGVCSALVKGDPLYNGNASFAYIISDASLTSAAVTATLTISAVSTAPVASSFTTSDFNEDTESGAITLNYSGYLGTQTASSCVLTAVSNVTESISSPCTCLLYTCTVKVISTSDYNGPASFNYTISDNLGTSNSATVTINNILPVNDAPVGTSVSPITILEDTASPINFGYTDVDGAGSAVSCEVTTSAASHISVTTPCACSAGDCTVGVTGALNSVGPASFDFTITDASLTSAIVTANLTITAVNDAPVATGIVSPANINEDVTTELTLGYNDIDGDFASGCTITSPVGVAVSGCVCSNISGICSVNVIGSPVNNNGPASFTYTVTDGQAVNPVSNTATANFTIDAVNDAPVANNITPASFNEDTESIITLSYSDIDGDIATGCAIEPSSLSNIIVTTPCGCDPTFGVCTVGITGATNYNGTASFTYTVTDGQAVNPVSNTATATLVINAVNDAPVANNITPASFNEDTESIIELNYTDVDLDKATGCAIDAGSLTNVTITTNCICDPTFGVCTVGITGATNYNGPASFTYTVTDGMAVNPVSNTVTASLTIDAVNDAPVLSGPCSTAAMVNDTYSCNLTASDPDAADTKTWSLDASNTCVWATGAINTSSGAVSHLLVGQDQGSCTLAIRMTDSASAFNVLSANVVITLPETSLGVSAPVVGAQLGYSVAVSGDFTIAGKPFDGGGQGSATTFFYNGSTWSEQTLTLPVLAASDHFGEGVAISGHTAVVGAPGDSSNKGAVYVYRNVFGLWSLPIKLTPADGAASDNFGHSVSITGDTIVVGSYGNLNKGAAYVYRYMNGTWAPDHKLTASDGALSDSFGFSVAIFENTIVIGAPNDDYLSIVDAGTAYVFRYNSITPTPTWTEETQLSTSTRVANDNFGYSVAISDGRILVGALNKASTGTNSGAAFVYHFDAVSSLWFEMPMLFPAGVVAGDLFGASVAISNDTLVVGSYAAGIGKAYYYHFEQNLTPSAGTWVENQTISDASGVSGDWFGYSVGISDDRIVIGSPLKDTGGITSSGYVLVKEINPKPKIQINPGPLFVANSYAGYSVAVSGDTALVGAYLENTGKGAAYIYKFNGTNWQMIKRLIPTSVSYGSLTQGNCSTAGTCFGYQVALSGKTAVISAHLATNSGGVTGAGIVYVFSYNETTNEWEEKNALSSNPVAVNNKFGSSVAISGDTLIVGAIGENDTSLGAPLGIGSGASYIFRYDGANWVQEQKLRADQLTDNAYNAENFGMSVAISGATAVVGASLDKVGGSAAAAGSILVYHYEFDSGSSSWKWVAKQRLQASDAASGDLFGYSVTAESDTVVVGAYGKGLQKGAAYVYSFNGSLWTETQKLVEGIDFTPSGRFGVSVAISGNTILVGGNYDTVHGGAAYIFDYNTVGTWVERAKIMDINGATGDNFGISVGLSGDTAVIGAYLNDVSAVNAGTAYFLDLRKY